MAGEIFGTLWPKGKVSRCSTIKKKNVKKETMQSNQRAHEYGDILLEEDEISDCNTSWPSANQTKDSKDKPITLSSSSSDSEKRAKEKAKNWRK